MPPKQNFTLECPGYKAFQVPWVYDRVLTGPHGHKTTRKLSAIWAHGFPICFKKQNCWLLKLWTCFGEKHGKTTCYRHVLHYAVWNINWELNIWRIAIGYPNIFREKIRYNYGFIRISHKMKPPAKMLLCEAIN